MVFLRRGHLLVGRVLFSAVVGGVCVTQFVGFAHIASLRLSKIRNGPGRVASHTTMDTLITRRKWVCLLRHPNSVSLRFPTLLVAIGRKRRE